MKLLQNYKGVGRKSHIDKFCKSRPDLFQCITPEIGRKFEKEIKTWSRYIWWWNRNWNRVTVSIKPSDFSLRQTTSEQELMCQWIYDIRIAQICGPDESLHSDKQWNIRCCHIHIFSSWNTDIRLYCCSAIWRHYKCQVCNCVALNTLFVASRLTGRLTAPLHSTETGFCRVTVIHFLHGRNILFSANAALFQELSVHKRKNFGNIK